MFALIVIDQQKGMDHPKLGKRNNPGAENEILNLLCIWREKRWPIIHVKHRSTDPNSVFWPLQEGFDFKYEFQPVDGECFIEKAVPCAFINSSLSDKLSNIGVNQIVIVGVATNNSIEATARTAGNLGYTTYVVENACYTFEKADYFGVARTAQEVHGMSLANLHGEYATVISSENLIQKINLTSH